MPGCDFNSDIDATNAARKIRSEQKLSRLFVVVEVRGINDGPVKQFRAEESMAHKIGLKRAGSYEYKPGVWRSVFGAPAGMSRKDFKVVSPSVLLKKWEHDFVPG